MNNYLLAHGFGFTNDYWNNLIKYLDGNIYFFDDPDLDQSKTYIGIGHSLGFLKLNNSYFKFEKLISLQGFLNFCGNVHRMRKIRDIEIEKVRSDLILNKDDSLCRFRKNCGYNEMDTTNMDLDALLMEIDMMKKSYQHCGIRTLAIGSYDDVIVPMSIINDNFKNIENVSILPIEHGKHALGYIQPKLIAEKINEF